MHTFCVSTFLKTHTEIVFPGILMMFSSNRQHREWRVNRQVLWEYHTSGSDNFAVSKFVDAIPHGRVYCRQGVRSHLCLHRYVGQLHSKCVTHLHENVSNRPLHLHFARDRHHVLFLPSDCGGVLTEDNGETLSPNFPNNYNHSDACAWLILAPEGAKIQVLNFSVSH